MKYVFLLLSLYSAEAFCQQSVYNSIYNDNVEVTTLDGGRQPLSDFRGQKIMVSVISPDNLQKGGLVFLDSLQQAFPKVKVIVIPADDFGGDNNEQILQSVKRNTARRSLVAASSSVKKSSAGKQNRLLKWLTTGKENRHFDDEVNTDNQFYVISESGYLYALLEKGVTREVIKEVLELPESELPEFKKH